jgi:hypothetical protein
MLRIHESTLMQTAIVLEESELEPELELEPEPELEPGRLRGLFTLLVWLDQLPRRPGLIDMTF